jgi:hypothetical protein
MTAVDAATTAILELMGPYLGTPEQIAKHGDRIKHRQTDAARKYAETAINAAIATGHLLPASAVADMRERCARVAEDHGQPYTLNTNTGAMMFRAVTEKIAAAIRQLDLSPAGGDYVMVPKSALDWLFGEGPDDQGKWFGESAAQQVAQSAPRAFWWRSKFRSLLNAAMGAGSSPSPNNGEG